MISFYLPQAGKLYVWATVTMGKEVLYRANKKSHATAICIIIFHDCCYSGLQVCKKLPSTYTRIDHFRADRDSDFRRSSYTHSDLYMSICSLVTRTIVADGNKWRGCCR